MPSVADYLAIRLKQLRADYLFGIPGNYSAEFLLAAAANEIKCIGTTNELEAGYAADAYARLRGIGVCSVTYGVGSQSLYNAIAGSYVEFCPVVLINGSPPLMKVANLQNRGILFAHAIDTIRTDRNIFDHVTVATAEISSAADAAGEIDRVLQMCITFRRPVYLEVHQQVWSAECVAPSEERLIPYRPSESEGDDQSLATSEVVAKVIERLREARRPVLWGGEMIQRMGLTNFFSELVKLSGLPYTTTLMGKGLIPETRFPNQFVGVYDSIFAPAAVRSVVEKSDCLIAIGTILSDFYADIATRPGAEKSLILAAGNAVRLDDALYPNVPLEDFLPRLLAEWRNNMSALNQASIPNVVEPAEARETVCLLPKNESELTFDSLFQRIGSFLNDDMLVLTDTSLALFPSAKLPISRSGGYLAQTAWLSIGYTCGATLGAYLAEPEPRPRPVVFVGDGGFQMIPQSFSTLVRENVPAIVFVLDNGLYGIEQFLVDEQILDPGERFYRDKLDQPSEFDVLPRWDYEQLAKAFGGRGILAATHHQLEEALDFAMDESGPILIAIRLHSHDLPAEIQSVVDTPRADGRQLAASTAASVLAVMPFGHDLDISDQLTPAMIALLNERSNSRERPGLAMGAFD